MSERKLVTVRIIKDILPIEGADKIEKAIIDGWQVVVKKGEFSIGQKCAYFEIDSFMPISPKFEFLRKSSYKAFPNGIEGFRLRSAKMRGQLSQGLALPLKELGIKESTKVGTDLTKKLKVLKYEPELLGQAHLKKHFLVRKYEQAKFFIKSLFMSKAERARIRSPKTFPSFFPKTDEERIQNLNPKSFAGKAYEVSEKIDGASCSIYYKDGDFGVCSRNYKIILALDEQNNPTGAFSGAYWKMAKKYNLEEKLANLNKNLAIQGEIIGSIQGNKYKLTEFRYYVFKIFLIDENRFATTEERANLVNELGLEHVPILEKNKIFDFIDTNSVLAYAEGKSAINKDTEREGVVFKAVDGSHSFKAISNKFLLKFEE